MNTDADGNSKNAINTHLSDVDIGDRLDHDLKAMLRQISFHAELIEDTPDDTTAVAEHVAAIVKKCALAQRLSQFSNLFAQARAPSTDFVEIDLRRLWTQVASLQRFEVSTFTINVDGQAKIKGEPALLSAAFREVLGNALAFSSPAQKLLNVTFEHTDCVCVTIQSYFEGSGPVPDIEAFKAAAVNGSDHGVGFGLFFARYVARKHEGDLVVSLPEPGVFSVRMTFGTQAT